MNRLLWRALPADVRWWLLCRAMARATAGTVAMADATSAANNAMVQMTDVLRPR